MKNVTLYIPKIDDLWFRQECMGDPKTMNYNAGYEVAYEGYHYETGCIDFPKEKWDDWYSNKFKNSNFFYAYILDKDIEKFVGYVNFKKQEDKKATFGIVIKDEFRGQGYMKPAMKLLIKKAKQKGVLCLIDTLPESRINALKVFYELGFSKVREFPAKKFNKDEIILEIEKCFD